MALLTFKFYKKRRNNSKRKDANIKFRNRRIVSLFLGIRVAITIALFTNYANTRNLTLNDLNFEMVKDFLKYCVDIYKKIFRIAFDNISSILC